MAVTLEPIVARNVWDSALELTKMAQERNVDVTAWAAHLASELCSAGVTIPSPELADLLVRHLCFENHLPGTWKLLEKSMSSNLAPRLLVLALLSSRVIARRRLHVVAYRLYIDLVKRYLSLSSLAAQTSEPHYNTVMASIDKVLGLSRIFDLQVCDPGILLVAFVFTTVWQLLDASLDDENLLQNTVETGSKWLSGFQDMEMDGENDLLDTRKENQEKMLKVNTAMAIELIGELLENKVTAQIILLARQNMPSQWRCFAQRVNLLASQSSAMRSSKIVNAESLRLLVSDTRKLQILDFKTFLKVEYIGKSTSCSIKSGGASHGTMSGLWLPIDIFLEDAMDGSQMSVSGGVKRLTGLVKSLQAINRTSWHAAFLGLWIAALRLVQRERDTIEGPVPRIETALCLLLSITTLAVSSIIEEEEFERTREFENNIQSKENSSESQRHAGLITCLQHLGDFENLLAPPPYVSLLAYQAASKAAFFVSGLSVSNGYCNTGNMNDVPINCYGNLRHLIVESCIARNLLNTSAYFWPGYVKTRVNPLPRQVTGQVSGWSSLVMGSPLTPQLADILTASPASSLPEIQKIYEIAMDGSEDEKILAATVLCGASLVRGWNIQEHTLIFIINLLCPPIPVDYSGTESHFIQFAPLLNVLLVGISSVDCGQIFSLHGLIPILATALLPICEVFGSLNYCSWTLPTGELTCHAVFSNAFTLLLRLWRCDKAPLEHVADDISPGATQISPEFLLLVRNRQLSNAGSSHSRQRRCSKSLSIKLEPVFMDSFPKLRLWYRQHIECATSNSGLLRGTPVHQIVDALLNMMFRKMKRGVNTNTGSTSGSSTSSGSVADDTFILLKNPAWDILEACPHVLDAALTACSHGNLLPRDLATGLKDLADFFPASLAAVTSYFSAEVTRGRWKPAFMNGTDWPSPAANLASVEQQIKKILAATGVDVPSVSSGESSQATLPLPLAAFVSLTITFKLEKVSQRSLVLLGPSLNALAAGCPWPCMPIVSSLWVQKVKRWSDFFIFSASRTIFHHNNDAVVQLLESCFFSTLGFSSPHILGNCGVSGLLGHGFGSHLAGGMSPVAPGILYLKVHRSVRNVMFLTEEILSILMHSVRKIASSGLPPETVGRLKKTKCGVRYQQPSISAALDRVRLAASLGASLVWISGGLSLVQSLIIETLPSWFISFHGPALEGGDYEFLVAMLEGYALAYMTLQCGTFAWGIDSASPASKRRPRVIQAHLEFLANALNGKIALGCNPAITRAYVTGFLSLMVTCSPNWVRDVDATLLKRLSKGLQCWNEEQLALSLLGLGGVSAMGAAAELIIEMHNHGLPSSPSSTKRTSSSELGL